MDKTTYVVSGFMRTGTSMMVKALEAGGMSACYSEAKNDFMHPYAREDYHPNVNGLYELEDADYKAWDFPKGYEGKLIKSLNAGVTRFAVMPEGIKVVFMMRDPQEIQASFIKFFGKEISSKQIDTYERDMADIRERIGNRKDVKSLCIMYYDDVLADPVTAFARLRHYGFPIDDLSQPVCVINPELRHCDVSKPETIKREANMNYPSALVLGCVK